MRGPRRCSSSSASAATLKVIFDGTGPACSTSGRRRHVWIRLAADGDALVIEERALDDLLVGVDLDPAPPRTRRATRH
jgi:hypothetical protein